jgi:hypothetical protein
VRDQPILILESSQSDVSGDITLFRRISEAEVNLEAIDVRNNSFFGYTLDGKRLALSADGNTVHIALADDSKDYSQNVRKLLEEYVSVIVERKKIGLMNVPMMTLSELVDEVGYYEG